MGCLGSLLFVSVGLFFVVALVLNFVFRLIMSPLAIPLTMLREHKRERNLTVVLYSAIFLFLWMLGLVLLSLTYLLIVWWHIREKKGKPVGGKPGALPWIPRVSLGELLVIVFSIGTCPLVVQWELSWVDHQQAWVFLVLALITFPLCFLCACYRLDSNRVPLGWARMAYLFLFPYVVLSVPIVCGPTLALLFVQEMSQIVNFVALPAVILIAGWMLSLHVRRLATEAAQPMPPVISEQLEAPQSSDARHP